jgi:hypothetical protein
MKRINLVLLIVGFALFAGLVWSIGPGELWHELESLGWGLIPFAAGEGVAEMIHTVGWRHCLSGRARTLPWFQLYRIRMSGYAINYLTPTAALGGELSKTTLLAFECDASQAASGVVVGKVCFACAHLLFVGLGSIFVMRSVQLAPSVWISLFASGLLVACGILGFLFLQKYGKLGGLARWLASRHIGGRLLEKAASSLTALDQELMAFYRDRPCDLWLAIGWHLFGYSIGILQTWLFLNLVQPPAPLHTAASIWFIGMWFDLLTFAVPMNMGSLEGSRVVALGLLGYGSPVGMAYGLAIRFAQIFWSAIGLFFYGQLTARQEIRLPLKKVDGGRPFSLRKILQTKRIL